MTGLGDQRSLRPVCRARMRLFLASHKNADIQVEVSGVART